MALKYVGGERFAVTVKCIHQNQSLYLSVGTMQVIGTTSFLMYAVLV